MKTLLPPPLLSRALPALVLSLAAASAPASLPQYSLTKVDDLMASPLQAGAADYAQLTVSVSAGPDGRSLATQFSDFDRLIGPPNPGIETASESYYITSPQTGDILRLVEPPAGYETGIGGATRVSAAGHVSFTVSDNRSSPDWLAGIEIARANPNGTVDVLHGLRGAEQRGVNTVGQVVALGSNEGSSWLYTDGSGWRNIGALPGTTYAVPMSLGNTGAVVGRSADSSGKPVPFIWTAGAGMEAITDHGTPIYGQATAINESGLVTGTANGRAFVLNSGNMELTWITEAATGWQALDINDSGAIIGASSFGGDILGTPVDSGFYWDPANGLSDLDGLLGEAVNEWFITGVTDLNNEGWILATGFNRLDRQNYQVLLRPVPEPGAGALLTMGGLGFLARRRRRRASLSSPATA